MHLGILWGKIYYDYQKLKEEERILSNALFETRRKIIEALRNTKLKNTHKEMLISSSISYQNTLKEVNHLANEVKKKEMIIYQIKQALQGELKEVMFLKDKLDKLNVKSQKDFEELLKTLPSLKTLKKRSKELANQVIQLYEELKNKNSNDEDFVNKIEELKRLTENLEKVKEDINKRTEWEKLYEVAIRKGIFHQDFEKIKKLRKDLEARLAQLNDEVKELTIKQYSFESLLEKDKRRIEFYRKLYIEAIRSENLYFKLKWERKSLLKKRRLVRKKLAFLDKFAGRLKELTTLIIGWLWERPPITINPDGTIKLLINGDEDDKQLAFLILKSYLENKTSLNSILSIE